MAETLLMVGLGDLGSRIARLGVKAGNRVVGMRRGDQTPASVEHWQQDAALPWSGPGLIPDDVVLCLSPSGSGAEAYRRAYLAVARQAADWLRREAPQAHVWLISSTGVYGQQQGEWVDEDALREPQRETARVLVEAENFWLEQSQPVTLLRPSGLYGPGREFMLRQAQTGVLPGPDQPVYTNRIHIDDAARAVMHLIQRRRQGLDTATAYNLTDTCPASLYDLLHWLHRQMGIEAVVEQPMQRPSKRVSHQRLKDTGFIWHYPSFREGYAAMLHGDSPLDSV
jgi:nucleoside-diphosphate-sugar epimerase